ncbi:MAG: hypothetical protein JWR69_4666, partial [Pedosphaera sp.]|nr:hypothetical protein [Pedosphaera sp.]
MVAWGAVLAAFLRILEGVNRSKAIMHYQKRRVNQHGELHGRNESKAVGDRWPWFKIIQATVLFLAVFQATSASAVPPGRVWAWGYNASGQCNVPADLTNAIAIAGGESHSLALRSDGTVVAWGGNNYGQINVPPGLAGVTAIAAGPDHNLALRADGTVVAWGDNSHGQIDVPEGLTNVVAIAGGGFPADAPDLDHGYSLALRSDGTVTGWGGDNNGQIDVPPGLSNVVAITASLEGALALKGDGTVVGWGSSWVTDVIPSGLSNVVALAGPDQFWLALKTNGSVVAWGGNSLYLYDHGQANVPADLQNVVAIAAGWWHGMALKTDGKMVLWGVPTPAIPPPDIPRVDAVAAGAYHSLAIAPSNAPPINQPPPQDWVRRGGGAGADLANSVAVDSNGNSYVLGTYGATAQFGGVSLTNRGTGRDIFVAKYDPQGGLLWVKSGGGTNYDYASQIALDAAGNCYIAGSIGGSRGAFDSATLTNNGIASTFIFIAKYDPLGNVVWAREASAFGNYLGVGGIALDAAGNLFLGGRYQNGIDLHGITLTNVTATAFWAKYDPNGNVIWARQNEVGSGGGAYQATGVSTDAAGNCYVTGGFSGVTASFGGLSITNLGAVTDVFVAKYDPDGNALWARGGGSGGGSYPDDVASAIITDAEGNCVVSGTFHGTVAKFGNAILYKVDPYNLNSQYQYFLVKYDTAGNVLWANTGREKGGANIPYDTRLALDRSGNCYVAGNFNPPFMCFGGST